MISCKDRKTGKMTDESLDVVVVRKKRFIDTLFTASVATLVSILYINFGCAIDWTGELRKILKRPIGPAIGFCGQFIAMPLVSRKSIYNVSAFRCMYNIYFLFHNYFFLKDEIL